MGTTWAGRLLRTTATSPLRPLTWEKSKDVSVGSLYTETRAEINTGSLPLRLGPCYTNGMLAPMARPGAQECWSVRVCYSKCLAKKPGQSRLRGQRPEAQFQHLFQRGTCLSFLSCHLGIRVPPTSRLVLRVEHKGILTITKKYPYILGKNEHVSIPPKSQIPKPVDQETPDMLMTRLVPLPHPYCKGKSAFLQSPQ